MGTVDELSDTVDELAVLLIRVAKALKESGLEHQDYSLNIEQAFKQAGAFGAYNSSTTKLVELLLTKAPAEAIEWATHVATGW